MPNFNSRCAECNGVVTKNELKCWVCGAPVRGAKKFSITAWLAGPDKPDPGKVAAKRCILPGPNNGFYRS
jgi:hypothetical protein